MTLGFSSAQEFSAIIGWELYQVTIDKHHLMFFFNDDADLLNIAFKMSYTSADGKINYEYALEGGEKSLNVDGILRKKVSSIERFSSDRLAIVFENGNRITVFNEPKIRSWWFVRNSKFEGSQSYSAGYPPSDCE